MIKFERINPTSVSEMMGNPTGIRIFAVNGKRVVETFPIAMNEISVDSIIDERSDSWLAKKNTGNEYALGIPKAHYRIVEEEK